VVLNIFVQFVEIELVESTMVFTVVKAVKVFLSVQCAKTFHMLVVRIKIVSLTRDKETDASIADIKNAWPWV
jgi:hypothetical protein